MAMKLNEMLEIFKIRDKVKTNLIKGDIVNGRVAILKMLRKFGRGGAGSLYINKYSNAMCSIPHRWQDLYGIYIFVPVYCRDKVVDCCPGLLPETGSKLSRYDQ